eukprot:c2203_g1_i1.p1 GENE.c2203_g1_i1~~c2203_g1_i1.p1  ORF type:complete len:127 (-),score=33.26 c2203_g1_i1:121-459(-)
MATRAYRAVLKTQRALFDKDIQMKSAALRATQEEFRKHQFESDPERVAQLVQDAYEAMNFLKHSVVQGTKKPDGSVSLRVGPDHVAENQTIHVQSISQAQQNLSTPSTPSCS